MENFNICRWIFTMFVLQSSVSKRGSFFEDILMDHDLLVDTNCLYDESSYPYHHRQVSHFNMKTNNLSLLVLNMNHPFLVMLICPTNKSELFFYLSEVAIVSVPKTVSNQPVYVMKWPEPNPTCLSVRGESLPNLQEEIILQEIVTRYPMDVDVYLSINCENTFGFGDNLHNSYLIELYSVCHTVPIIQPISKKLFNRELATEDIANKIERRSNFHGASLRAINYGDFSVENYETILDELMSFTVFALNISLTVINGTGWIASSCYEWGKESSESELSVDCPLTGMGQQILSGEAHFTLTYTELVPFRVRFLKSLQPIYVSRVIALFRQPHWSLFRNIYIKSFSPLLWLILLITTATIVCSVIGISYIHIRISTMNSCAPETINVQEGQYVTQSILWLISAITMQGWHRSAVSLPFKIIQISTSALALVCIAVYSGTIFSILSNQKGPITDYPSLVKSNLPVVADGRMLGAIQAAKVLYSRRGLTENIKMTGTLNIDEAYQTINSSNTVLLTSRDGWLQFFYSTNISLTTSKNLCENYTHYSDKFGAPILGVMYMQQNSSLREYINYPFVVLIETGLRHRFNWFYSTRNSLRCLEQEKQPEAFGINEVYSVYVVLALGFALSVTFLLIEKTISFRYRSHTVYREKPLNDES